MERVAREEQLALQLFAPPSLDKTQIKLLVRPIDFVADKRVPEVCKVNPNLMRPASARKCAHNREFSA